MKFISNYQSLVWVACGLVFVMCMVGCASNGARFDDRQTTYHPDGTVTVDETTMDNMTRVTWGSEIEEGAGQTTYTAHPDGSFSITTGGASKGLQAGDGNAVALGILELVKPRLPVMTPQAQVNVPMPEPQSPIEQPTTLPPQVSIPPNATVQMLLDALPPGMTLEMILEMMSKK